MAYGFGKGDFENKKLVDSYSWELKNSWAARLGSPPAQKIDSADYSRAYEMAKAHLLKLENGEYALIIEEGCSCYMSEDAKITLYGDKSNAKEKFREWKKQEEQWGF